MSQDVHVSLRLMSMGFAVRPCGHCTDLPRSGHSRAARLFQLLMCIGMTEIREAASMQAQEHEYDIIGHPQLNFSFVVVFPFHPYTDGRPGGEASFSVCP